MACLLETPIRMSVLSVSDPPQPLACPRGSSGPARAIHHQRRLPLGHHPLGWPLAQLWAGEAAGLGQLPMLPGWGKALGKASAFHPRETELLGTALGGRELREPAPRGLAVSCFCWTEVWSACFHPILDKPASGIPGGPGVLLGPGRGWGGRHMEALMGQEAELGGMPSNAARFFAA